MTDENDIMCDGITEYTSTVHIAGLEIKNTNGLINDSDIESLIVYFKSKQEKFKDFKLGTNLLPKYLTDKKLAKVIGQTKWKTLRKDLYEKSLHKCEICNKDIEKEGVTFVLADVFEYNFDNLKITLKSLNIMCGLCNLARNFGTGFAIDDEKKEEVREHFLKANNCTIEEYEEYKKYISDLNTLFMFVNNIKWYLDYGKFASYIPVKTKKEKPKSSIWR